MPVWTISAQPGTSGDDVAARLAARAEVALFDRKALAPLAEQLSPELGRLDDVEGRFGGRLNALSLALAMTYGAPDAFQELELRRLMPDLARKVVGDVARRPAVIFAPAAAPALPDDSLAIRVRLWAPEPWRIANHSRSEVVDAESARRELAHADHVERTWVHALFDVRIDDPSLYTVVLDASRLAPERIVDVLLTAAGMGPAAG